MNPTQLLPEAPPTPMGAPSLRVAVEPATAADPLRLLATVLEDAHVGVALLDEDLRVRSANRWFADLAAAHPVALMGHRFGEALAGLRPHLDDVAAEVLRTGRATRDVPAALPDRRLRFTFHRIEEDGCRGVGVTVRDAQRDHVAHTLQTGLLTTALPAIDGFDLAVSSRPVEAVGGDFYDAFALGDGAWGLLLGDVCGKGAEAAALTGQARYGVRTITGREQRPAAVLRELNDTLLRHGTRERFCTGLFARVDERERRVTVACAGHPAPLLVRAGSRPEPVPVSGTLLGVTRHPLLRDEDLTLRPGDALVLYTDGIPEARTAGGGMVGTEGVIETLASLPAGSAQELADGLVRLAQTDPEGQRDDAAALVLRAR